MSYLLIINFYFRNVYFIYKSVINFSNSLNYTKYINPFLNGDEDRFLPNLINPFAFLNECLKTQALQHKSCNCILNDNVEKLDMGKNNIFRIVS